MERTEGTRVELEACHELVELVVVLDRVDCMGRKLSYPESADMTESG